ncbi:hypothetical protein BHE74_00038009 [Ensete ventricosum]|nr:hypothetical protein BHE74_00038009 [Ensete ventricosum]
MTLRQYSPHCTLQEGTTTIKKKREGRRQWPWPTRAVAAAMVAEEETRATVAATEGREMAGMADGGGKEERNRGGRRRKRRPRERAAVLSWRKRVERGIIDLFEEIEPPRSLRGDLPHRVSHFG